MARNGSGTYTLPLANVVAGDTILASWANSTMTDIGTALTASLAKDGQTVPSANLPMGTYRHTGVGAATTLTDYTQAKQVVDNTLKILGSIGGSVDAITATAPLSMSAYVTGQQFSFTAAGTNTSTMTININSIGVKAITVRGTTAVGAGEITSGERVIIEYDGTRFQRIAPTPPPSSLVPTGGGTDKIFWENEQTVTANYTIANNYNAGSFGPITINNGISVTIGAGEVWTIV